jgi:hypothetical protein
MSPDVTRLRLNWMLKRAIGAIGVPVVLGAMALPQRPRHVASLLEEYRIEDGRAPQRRRVAEESVGNDDTAESDEAVPAMRSDSPTVLPHVGAARGLGRWGSGSPRSPDRGLRPRDVCRKGDRGGSFGLVDSPVLDAPGRREVGAIVAHQDLLICRHKTAKVARSIVAGRGRADHGSMPESASCARRTLE